MDLLPGIPLADRVRQRDRFSMRFYGEVLKVRTRRKVNGIAARALDLGRHVLGREDARQPDRSLSALRARLEKGRERSKESSFTKDVAESFADFRDLFAFIKPPSIATHFRNDRFFAWQRVAGANPIALRAIEKLPENFPVPEDVFRATAGHHDSLEAAGREGRLYLVDYAVLDGLDQSKYLGRQKYLSAPLALFVQRHATRQQPPALVPVAIQCAQRPGPDVGLLTPLDGMRWEMAKTMVQIADAHVHELISHLGYTHLIMERVALGAERSLADEHPLKLLLRPHYEFTFHINRTARNNLLAVEGEVQRVLAITLNCALGVVHKALEQYAFDDHSLEPSLAMRGVGDVEGLQDYPYRDDARLIWRAIENFVDGYLRLYYFSDEDVVNDSELRALIDDLRHPDGGRLGGLADVRSIDRLRAVITQFIFTGSAQHTAVNKTQFEFFGFAPNAPGASYAPPPTPDTPNTLERFLAMFPPMEQSVFQLNVLYELSEINVNHLGQFAPGWFEDDRVRPLVEAFQGDLAEAETTIKERNRSRPFSYNFLLPSTMAASVHI
jgi:arachidonate 15-lipoxygenase